MIRIMGINSSNEYWTGIGTRNIFTFDGEWKYEEKFRDSANFMKVFSTAMMNQGKILRSGHAVGFDAIAEEPYIQADAKCEIYITLRRNMSKLRIGNKVVDLVESSSGAVKDDYTTIDGDTYISIDHSIEVYGKEIFEKAYALVSSLHPAWHKCDERAQLLHTRNAFQVLGRDLSTPTGFVVLCAPWASDDRRAVRGGTNMAMQVARLYNIPIFNLIEPHDRDVLRALM